MRRSSELARAGRTAGWTIAAGALVAALVVLSAVPASTSLPTRSAATDRARPIETRPSVLVPAGTPTWTDADPSTSAPALFYPSVAYDVADGYLVLFGGCTGVICSSPSNQTWIYHDGTWSELALPVVPPAREEAAMTYDGADRAIVLYGGQGPSVGTDTWEFHGGAWSKVTTSANPGTGRVDSSFAYDASDGYAVLFGGYGCTSTCGTWTYRAGAWSSISIASPPPMRYGASMAYSATVRAVVMFGGVDTSGNYLADTWEFAAGNWSEAGGGPAERSDGQMGFDGTTGEIVLFGGEYVTLSNFPGVTYDDTWEFGAGGWTELAPAASPAALWEGTMAADGPTGGVVLVGGCGSSCPDPETWIFGTAATVAVRTTPAACGTVDIAGQAVPSGGTASVAYGEYATIETPCAHYRLPTLSGADGVVPGKGRSSWIAVNGSGTLSVLYAPDNYTLGIAVSPARCGPLTVNGTAIVSGGNVTLPFGPYNVSIGSCPGETFAGWTLSGANLSLPGGGSASTELELASSGNLTARFVPATSGLASGFAGIPIWAWLLFVMGVSIAAVLTVGVVLYRRAKSRGPPSAAEPDPRAVGPDGPPPRT